MPLHSPVFNDRFFKLLRALDGLTEETSLNAFIQRMGLPQLSVQEVLQVVEFMQSLECSIGQEKRASDIFLVPPKQKEKVLIDLSFSQWLALQAHFPLMSQYQGNDFHQHIAEELERVINKYPHWDLFRVVEENKSREQYQAQEKKKRPDVLSSLEDAIKARVLLQIELASNKKFEIYPHRIVFLDEALCLVGEDTNDRCLIWVKIDEMLKVRNMVGENYVPNFSPLEVKDFISAIRIVSGKEERLVLKVVSDKQIDLQPPYHFLGNPYVTANSQGDLIWGASVEVSQDLFEWLLEIKEHVEILDPQKLKYQFEEFCRGRQCKVLKKAS